ncbi:MAG: GTP 3',8-cyclase MoaA [Candidatus Bathyarchaeia archaeon]
MICDSYGRPVLNFRISVTQKCNLRCPYCHREGEVVNSSTEMTLEEIVRITRIAVNLGVERVKLTGGEPLLRSDILQIVEGIAELKGLKDLSMTTNGTPLASMAKDLRRSGLDRVNVSIPSLIPENYRKLTGGNLTDAVSGIKAAVKAGLYPVKLNMVMLKGINEGEVLEMINFARYNGVVLQLIELEPLGINRSFYSNHHYALDGIEGKLEKQALEFRTRSDMQNRRVYFLPGVKVEVVKPIENTAFCAHCTRIRLTSDGKVKPCLMRNDNLVDVLTPLRSGADDDGLTKLFIEAVKRREPFYKAAKR